jgi:3-oxoacyl-[acyl-carrier-protein] synthase III
VLGGKNHACVTGVGDTEYSKKIERSAEVLAVEATKTAAADAGIRPEDIDGIIT